MSKLGEMGIGVVRVKARQDCAGPPMQPHALDCAHVLVDRVADERVREAKPAGYPRGLVHHSSGDGFLEALEDLARGPAAQGSECADIKFPSQDGCERERAPTSLAESLQAPRDHRSDSLRRRAHLCTGGEQAHDLAYKQRIAPGLVVHRVDERLRSDNIGARLDETTHVRTGEARERELPRGRLARNLGERRQQRMVEA
jgi:hypothetical protein